MYVSLLYVYFRVFFEQDVFACSVFNGVLPLQVLLVLLFFLETEFYLFFQFSP